MKRIFKYPLDLTSFQTVQLPVGSKIISVGNQCNKLRMWVEVDPEQRDTQTRKIVVVGTGHTLPDVELRFIGTVPINEGTFIWHIYENLS